MSKLRKFIITPHLYWRDFLLKRNPYLAWKIYHHLKVYAPSLAEKLALKKKKTAPKGITTEKGGSYFSTLYEFADRLSHKGDHDQAEKVLLGIMKNFPQPPDQNYLKFLDLYATIAERKNDWSSAVERWQERVQLNKHDLASLHQLLRCLRVSGHEQAADNLATQEVPPLLNAGQESTSFSEHHLKLFDLYVDLAASRGDWEEAADRMERLISTLGHDATTALYSKLIDYYTKLDRMDMVEKTMRKGLEILYSKKKCLNNYNTFNDNLFGAHPRLRNENNTLYLIDKAVEYINNNKSHLIIVVYPNLRRMNNLSQSEKNTLTVGLWKCESAYFKYLHSELEHFDENYMRFIYADKNMRFKVENCTEIYDDFESKYINYRNGERITIGQPQSYENSVYFIGSSNWHHGVEDQYTPSSCLQKIFNKNNIKIRAVNKSRNSNYMSNQVATIKGTNLTDGDIVVLELTLANKDFCNVKSFCAMRGIAFHDFNENFMDKRYIGEMFIDWSHISYKGHAEIARLMWEYFFRSLTLIKSHKFNKFMEIYKKIEDRTFLDNNTKSKSDPVKDNVDSAYHSVPIFNTGKIGCIIMNCNPITLGHLHLITIASQIVNHLYIFVVEEDRSAFPFADRIEMIRRATTHLKNVVVVPSGRFILSIETFPEYFVKDMKQEASIDTSHDISIFGQYVAKKFNISIRFVGEEPTDAVTRQYNEEMKNSLPKYGVQVIEIPRLESGDEAISASRVRRLLKDRLWDDIARICPQTTVDYLIVMDKEGRLTI